jgi:hypothetical protein
MEKKQAIERHDQLRLKKKYDISREVGEIYEQHLDFVKEIQ